MARFPDHIRFEPIREHPYGVRGQGSLCLGLKNLSIGGISVLPSKHSSTHAVGEAYAHVQGESLKAYAALLWRLLNSPITRPGANNDYWVRATGN